MNRSKITETLEPIMSQIEKRSAVTDTFVDKETYRLYLTTFWANLVMDPEEAQLADCLDLLNFADELVVVLDKCTDGSKVIAEDLGQAGFLTGIHGAAPGQDHLALRRQDLADRPPH